MIIQKGQLYFDDKLTNLTKEKIDAMLDEKFYADCYPIALKHFLSITDKIHNCEPNDLQWLQMEYTVPFFANLVFRCKNMVYCVLFCKIDDQNLVSYPIDVHLLLDQCKENDLTPVLLPFNKKHEIVNLTGEKWNLIDAEMYFDAGIISARIPEEEATYEFKPSSSWELYNMSVMALVEDLCNKQGIEQCLYQVYPGVDPAICWIDKKNVFNWIVIRIWHEGLAKVQKPVELLNKISKNNGIGHYGICEINYPNGDKVYPRGQKFDLKFEIDDL